MHQVPRIASWYRATFTVRDGCQPHTDGGEGWFPINAHLVGRDYRYLHFFPVQLESLDAASEILLLTYTMNSLFWGEYLDLMVLLAPLY